MTLCPRCGETYSLQAGACPRCGTVCRTPFSIRAFLWDNFRLFTMVGMIGTMISLIPNMGNRILGATWITGTDTFLPLFLSIIIFFGTLFLSILFWIIFAMILEGRNDEGVVRRIGFPHSTCFSWHEGDLQRTVLFGCLVPMWIGIVLFFLLLMPQIPNRYSWFFSAILMLTVVPLAVYLLLGWKIGKTVTEKVPYLAQHKSAGLIIFVLIVIVIILSVPLLLPELSGNTLEFAHPVSISPDETYYGPGISSARGLRLEAAGLSGRELLSSRFRWSADYGYFISVIPSTSEVTILGNPAMTEGTRHVFWTFPDDAATPHARPVRIDLEVIPFSDQFPHRHASLCLDWFSRGIVQVNATCPP